jgi:hypothetical protein
MPFLKKGVGSFALFPAMKNLAEPLLKKEVR